MLEKKIKKRSAMISTSQYALIIFLKNMERENEYSHDRKWISKRDNKIDICIGLE